MATNLGLLSKFQPGLTDDRVPSGPELLMLGTSSVDRPQ